MFRYLLFDILSSPLNSLKEIKKRPNQKKTRKFGEEKNKWEYIKDQIEKQVTRGEKAKNMFK